MKLVQQSDDKKDVNDYKKRKYFIRWGGDVIELHCDPDEPSVILKQALEKATGIPVDDQRIFYAGMKKPFEHDKNLRYYGAQGGGFFDLARAEDLDESMNIIRRTSRRATLPAHSASAVMNDESAKEEKLSAIAAAEEKRKRLEAFQAKRKAAEDKKAQEEAAREKEEAEKRKKKEEAARRKADEEAARREKARLEEEARKAAAEEAARKAAEPINVQVKTPDGKTIPVQMKRSDTIKIIQDQVASASGIEVLEQILKFNGKELVSYETADGVGLQDGCFVDLELKPITVHVKKSDGKTIPVQMNPYDTIQFIKEKLAPETGMPVDEQVLKSKGKELSNNETARIMGLKDGSIIDLEFKLITVKVKTPDGNTIPVQMKLSDTIQFMKEKLGQETSIAVDEQVLKSKGKQLPNDKSAKDLGLEDGSVIDLETKLITVQVKTPDGNSIPVQMKPSDTIQFIKEKLTPKTGMPVHEQVLKLNEKDLPNDQTAKDMGLKDGSYLDLESELITVQVKTPDGKTIPVQIKPSDTIQFVKEKLVPKTGMTVDEQVLKLEGKELPNNQTAKNLGLKDCSVIDLETQLIMVHVQSPDGKTIPIQMKPSDTIQFIKEKLAPETNMTVDEQVLKSKGKELPNNETAKNMGLKDGSTINLEPILITVQVKTPDGMTVPLQMKPSDTIQFMKEKLAPKTGMTVDEQVLKANGRQLPNNETAKDMGLKDGSIVDLEARLITVHVKTPDGKTVPLQMKPFETIQSVKEKLALKTGMAVDEQVLKLKGKELPTDQNARDIGLKDGSVIDLEPKLITVQVKTPDGNTIPIQMKPCDTIQFIKEKLAPKTGIAVAEQILRSKEKEFTNDQNAKDIGLKDGSVIVLEPKLITVQVKTPDYKIIPVQMKSSDTIQFLKEQLVAESGIEVSQQVLEWNGKEVSNGDTVNSMGLRDGAVINLKPKSITVQVKKPDGRFIPVQIKPSDTIQFLKEQVASESGIEVPHQVLEWNGHELSNYESSDAVGLKDGSVINLGLKPISIQIRTPDGKSIPVQMKPSDTFQSVKEKVALEAGIEVAKQVLKFNGNELSNSKTAGEMSLQDGSLLDLEAKAEPKKEKEKKMKKKKSSGKDSDEFPVHKPKDYSTEFTPTPFDLSRFKVWFMIGDQVPFEMTCPAAIDVKGLKVEILKLRNEARFVKKYFEGLEDANELKIYPPGSYGEGDPLPDDLPVPRNSSEYALFSVMR